MVNRLRQLWRKKHNDTIKIELCDDDTNKGSSRTTGDQINGSVWIITRYLLRPGMIEIAFRGKATQIFAILPMLIKCSRSRPRRE